MPSAPPQTFLSTLRERGTLKTEHILQVHEACCPAPPPDDLLPAGWCRERKWEKLIPEGIILRHRLSAWQLFQVFILRKITDSAAVRTHLLTRWITCPYTSMSIKWPIKMKNNGTSSKQSSFPILYLHEKKLKYCQQNSYIPTANTWALRYTTTNC